MQNPLAIFLVVAAVLVAAGGTLYGYLRKGSTSHEISAAQPTTGGTRAPHLASGVHRSMPSTPVSIIASLKPSYSERLKKDDWRAFAIDAMSHSQDGGYFYAAYVTNKCSSALYYDKTYVSRKIQETVDASGTVTPEVLKAANRFASMCATFAPGEASELLGKIRSLSRNGADPFLEIQNTLSAALRSGNLDEIKSSFLKALLLNDLNVLLTSDLLQKVMMTNAGSAGRTQGDMWFDGKMYHFDTPDYSTLSAALNMLNCTKDSYCESDFLMLLSCVGGQACGTDASDYLNNKFVGAGLMDSNQFRDAQMLAQKMREAVRERNIEAFVH